MQLILITQRNRKVNKCNVSYCEVLLFLQRNFMLNPVKLPKHTYTQRACDRWQILLKRCYVHKSFAPAWGEAANRSRRTIEPVSAWAAPRWETIRLQAAESRYDKLCVLSQSLVCVCVCAITVPSLQGSAHWDYRDVDGTLVSPAERITSQNQIKSLILCLCYSKVYRETAFVLMSLCKLKPRWKIE